MGLQNADGSPDPAPPVEGRREMFLLWPALMAALLFGAVAWTSLPPGWIRTMNRLAMIGSARLQELPDAPFYSAMPEPFGGVALAAGLLMGMACLVRWRLVRRFPHRLGAAVCLLGGGTLLAEAIKAAMPPVFGALGYSGGPARGFPSGHATMALALGLAGLFLARPRWRPTAAALAGLLSATLNYSLLRARYHLPFEILGAVLMTLCLAFLLLAFLPPRPASPSLTQSLSLLVFGALGLVLLVAGIILGAAAYTVEPGPMQAAAAYGAGWRLVVGSGLLAPALVLLCMSRRAHAVLGSEG